MQMNLDLGWNSDEEPSIPLEEARGELVTLMTAAIVAVCAPRKEDDDDEQHASEDRL